MDEPLLRIAALYKVEDAIRGSDPDHRRAVRREMSRPLVDEFFTWLTQPSPQPPAHFPLRSIQDPRGFLLPRFFNLGRQFLDANVTPRPTSKNLQESRL